MEKVKKDGIQKEPRELPQYTEGLLQIMSSNNVSLKDALKIALEDLNRSKGYEHVEYTKEAYRFLKKQAETKS